MGSTTVSTIVKISPTIINLKSTGRQRIIAMRNKLRSRHRFAGITEEDKVFTSPTKLDTSESTRRSAKSDHTISDFNEDIISDAASNKIPMEKTGKFLTKTAEKHEPTSVLQKFTRNKNTSSRKKSFVNNIRVRQPLIISSSPPSIATAGLTVSSNVPLAQTPRTVLTTPLRRRPQLASIPSNTPSPAVPFSRPHIPAFERTLPPVHSNSNEQPLAPAFTEHSAEPSSEQVELLAPVLLDQSRSRQSSELGQGKSTRTETKPSKLTKFTMDEGEKQRMVAKRARTKIRTLLPEGENEGDSLERLRARIESLKHQNPARGRGR